MIVLKNIYTLPQIIHLLYVDVNIQNDKTERKEEKKHIRFLFTFVYYFQC